MTKDAYSYDHAGLYLGVTEADASPLEPGKYLLPARATFYEPPSDWPQDRWPRWDGAKWVLVAKPAQSNSSAVVKLQAFLNANPDVRELLEESQ